MTILDENIKNAVLQSMIEIIKDRKSEILAANKKDLTGNTDIDQVLIDRLKLDASKVDGMISSLQHVLEKPDPIHHTRYEFTHANGMKIVNKTFPFGSILIIYESRPDVTIEAAAIAFKSGNSIILKGGKEAMHSNLILVDCWKKALVKNSLDENWIQYLKLSRQETRDYLREHRNDIDLIVPRGGEGLIKFVKENARCPVLVSGRGNNFLYIDQHANAAMALDLIKNGKLGKISACNALDKVLIHEHFPKKDILINNIIQELGSEGVKLYSDKCNESTVQKIENEDIWYEEFLDYKLAFTTVTDTRDAISKINKYSGGHSATVITDDENTAHTFLLEIDAAAVYHNVSTRFTDGGQFGLGAELAISTDKLHHRGPLGLEQLVTNKWYIYGDGQVR